MAIPDNALSVQEVARQCRVQDQTVRLWIRTGRLRAHRASAQPTGRLWIDPEDLAAMLSRQTGGGEEEQLSDYRPGEDELGIGLLRWFDLADEQSSDR